jgi:hypothetical protein
LRRVKALGVRGTYYSDYMPQPLEVNYHPRHKGSRSACARGVRRLLEESVAAFGSAGLEHGFLHAVVLADHVAHTGTDAGLKSFLPSWPITALLDKRVPLWHLALHGLIVHESHGLDWEGAMNTILMGGAFRDEWSAHPGVMPVLDDKRIGQLKAMYDLTVSRFGRLRAAEMMCYEEPSEGVKVSRFADGTEIVADFAARKLRVNGESIAQPAALT